MNALKIRQVLDFTKEKVCNTAILPARKNHRE